MVSATLPELELAYPSSLVPRRLEQPCSRKAIFIISARAPCRSDLSLELPLERSPLLTQIKSPPSQHRLALSYVVVCSELITIRSFSY